MVKAPGPSPDPGHAPGLAPGPGPDHHHYVDERFLSPAKGGQAPDAAMVSTVPSS